ncbi:MAG TPA: hypothetical protein VNZ86_06340, partial [Bacteroidia bacterium]|nr:hypothetical protein [Bacteroidia bacterium]
MQTDWRKGRKIPLQVIVSGVKSNADTFYIVKPQTLGFNGTLNSSGILGSGIQAGINWGSRSRRGAMIIDQLNLTFTGGLSVSTSDTDPLNPYDEGFLPFNLICKDDCLALQNIRIDVSGVTNVGGPGGGGGGNGEGSTPTQPALRHGLGFTSCEDDSSTAKIANRIGLNGCIGGLAWSSGASGAYFASGGGGTGFPFSVGGLAGGPAQQAATCDSPGPTNSGGSSGSDNPCSGGGGGGFATPGTGSSFCSINYGYAVGDAEMIPFAGGSGGAGGKGNCHTATGSGGGGGGAIHISAKQITFGSSIVSAGSSGQNAVWYGGMPAGTNGCGDPDCMSAGGGGSGGSIYLSAKTQPSLMFGGIDVHGGDGGTGGSYNNDIGGKGGLGRVRFDGMTNNHSSITPGANIYIGPSTDTSNFVQRTFTLTGTGNGSNMQIYIR